MAGIYLCETCFDEMTGHVVDVRGFEEAICDGCIGEHTGEEAITSYYRWSPCGDHRSPVWRVEETAEGEVQIVGYRIEYTLVPIFYAEPA